MKHTTTIAILMLILFSCRTDDNGQAKKDELKTVVLSYFNALAQKDLQKANSLTTENLVYCENGVYYSNQSAINEVAQMPAFTVTFTIDSLNVHVEKKDASAYYLKKADFNFKDSGNRSYTFFETATFNKVGDQWKLRVLHSSTRK